MKDAAESKYWRYGTAGVLCVAFFLFLFNLQSGAFWDYDEGIYAQVIHDTLETGNLVTLHDMGSGWFEKPPAIFWAAMAAGSVIHTKEFAYRLPSALMGIIAILLVMLIAYSLTQRYRIACIAGIILLTSPPFLEAARQLRLDVPVATAILFTVLAFIKGVKNDKWYIGVGVGIALGILCKSVIGLLPFLFIFIWALLYRDFSWLKNKYMWYGGAIGLLIVAPWHIYQSLQYGSSFWDVYLFFTVLHRFQGNVVGGQSASSNSTYFFFLSTFALPWSILSLAAGGLLPWLKKKGMDITPSLVFFGFSIAVFILFIFAGTKLADYLTPIYPFIAIFLALVGTQLFDLFKNKRAPFLVGCSLLLVAASINTIYVGFNMVPAFKDNQIISNDEQNIGLLLAASADPSPVYTYQYDYWDTIRYYSNERFIQKMNDSQDLTQGFFLVVPGHFFESNSLSSDLHPVTVYKGEGASLYKITI